MAETGTPTALDDDTARRELDRYRKRSWAWMAGGLVALVPAVLLIAPLYDIDEEVPVGQAAVAMVAIAGVIGALILGAGGLARVARTKRMLASSPWRRWSSVFVQEKIGSYERNLLRLTPDSGSQDQAVVTAKLPSMLKSNLTRSGLIGARQVDVAGDPTAGPAVVRAEHHEFLVPVRRPLNR